MKNNYQFIILCILCLTIIGSVFYIKGQNPNYSKVKEPYLMIEDQIYFLSSHIPLKVIGKNFKDIGIVDKKETTIFDINNYHIYVDEQQKEIMYIGDNNQYLCLIEASYFIQEHGALPPVVQIHSKTYIHRTNLKLEEVPKGYQYLGTIDYYYYDKARIDFSTNADFVVNKKVYVSQNDNNYVYMYDGQYFTRWDIEGL